MALSAAGLLAAWEEGLTQHPVQRALTLLASAWPELSVATFAQLSIGQRDAFLLSLREQLFGPRLAGVARCAQCAERLELAFEVADIRVPASAELSPAPAEALELDADGYRIRFRLPNSIDLLAIAGVADPSTARAALLERCLLAYGDDANAPAPGNLPAATVEALTTAMELADPQGDVHLALNCPACGYHWLQAFDILSYLWSEIDDWAQRTLREVHLLASAYGWSEREILALSARRRQSYLEMVLV
jgi:hypothetical protein